MVKVSPLTDISAGSSPRITAPRFGTFCARAGGRVGFRPVPARGWRPGSTPDAVPSSRHGLIPVPRAPRRAGRSRAGTGADTEHGEDMTLHLSRRSLLVAAALGASTLPFVADIGVAQAASTNGYAFLWADQPTSASYTPSTTYQTNSLGGTNTIVRNGTGDYSITLPGMAGQGGDGGNVQVTAYGSSGTERCKVASWAPNWLGMTVNVRCHATSGSAADSRFTMMYQNNNAVVSYYDQGYVWANQATTGSYTAPAPYSWNSRGGANTIQRLGTGRYSVTFSSLVV